MTDIPIVELAERCEKATGRDRELDFAIYEACVGCLHDPVVQLAELSNGEIDAIPVCKKCGAKGVCRTFKMFTASLDAAMTLVPEGGYLAGMSKGRERAAFAAVRAGDTLESGHAETLPLALCAAVLRARATLAAMTKGEE